MVSPRLDILTQLDRNLSDETRRREGMIQSGRLVSVGNSADTFGQCSVEISGKFGTAVTHGVGSLIDNPESLIGLQVALLVPTGELRHGSWILGPHGPQWPIADFTVLSAVSGMTLEARDRAAFGDVTAWEGTGEVAAGMTVVVNAVVLVLDDLTSGSPVVTLGGTHYRLTGYDKPVYTLTPATPFRITAPSDSEATFTMALDVDRLGAFQIADAVLQARYTTDGQPSEQPVQVRTTSGAGVPYMRLVGRRG